MNRWTIRARSLARKTGLIHIINRLRPNAPYEQRVHNALVNAIRLGDVVWDVGANVGIYTKLFCEIVGKAGSVVAFEPLPASCEQIQIAVPGCAWLRIENIALGDADRDGRLMLEGDSVEHHLAGADSGCAQSIPVEVCTGDTVLDRLGRVPNVIKVDVEGFEEEVLQGMRRTLANAALRTVLVEVHFSKLEKRGRATAPLRIEALLRSNGLRTIWVDSSHLLAQR